MVYSNKYFSTVILSTGFSVTEVVRMLLGHNGSNGCEITLCYLRAWEGNKITSVKKDHDFSTRMGRSHSVAVALTSSVGIACRSTFQKWSHWPLYISVLIYTDLFFISLSLGCYGQSLISELYLGKHIILTLSSPCYCLWKLFLNSLSFP